MPGPHSKMSKGQSGKTPIVPSWVKPLASDVRIAKLEAALREARGAIWELRVWRNRRQFESDPAVVAIDHALSTSD